MRVIDASFHIEDEIDGLEMLRKIERAGRVCYKSEEKINDDSAKIFVKNIIKRGHESVIEHEKVTVKFICDRGVSHEIVRHRIASYSQESTRYCNYGADKFGRELSFIRPVFWNADSEEYAIWTAAMESAENNYLKLTDMGASPQEARSILPNSLKTEIVVTMNLREWRHFFKARTVQAAHPQIRQIACPLLETFKTLIPVVFDDIVVM